MRRVEDMRVPRPQRRVDGGEIAELQVLADEQVAAIMRVPQTLEDGPLLRIPSDAVWLVAVVLPRGGPAKPCGVVEQQEADDQRGAQDWRGGNACGSRNGACSSEAWSRNTR